MPEVAEIQTFRFDELEGAAKDRARSWMADGSFAVEIVSEMFDTELEQRGLSDLKVEEWCLGHVQGDGVTFKGSIDLGGIEAIQGNEGHGDQAADEAHIAAIKAIIGNEDAGDFSVGVEENRADCDYYGETFDRLEELDEAVTAWVEDLARRFARMGYAEIDYQDSEENLNELADANGYLFDRTGRPIHHLIETPLPV